MATNTTNTTNTTLASRTAVLLSKTAAYGVAEKAIAQAIAARRVYPAMAEDFGAQLGVELPLKTKDFTRVVGHLLASTEKPLKGVISKKKSEIFAILAELVGALTDTPPMALPAWAMPKERAKKSAEATEETEAVDVAGALEKANMLAEAEAKANVANVAKKLADAVALIVANAGDLTAGQRSLLASVLATTEDAPV